MDTLLNLSIWAMYLVAPLGAIAAIAVSVGLVRAYLDARRDDA